MTVPCGGIVAMESLIVHSSSKSQRISRVAFCISNIQRLRALRMALNSQSLSKYRGPVFSK